MLSQMKSKVQFCWGNSRLNNLNLFSVERLFGLFCLFEEFERFLRWAIIDYRKKDRPHQVRSVFSFCVHSAKSFCPCSEDRYSCRQGSRTRANDWICSFEISRSIFEDFFISVLLWRMRLELSFCLIIGNRILPISFQKLSQIRVDHDLDSVVPESLRYFGTKLGFVSVDGLALIPWMRQCFLQVSFIYEHGVTGNKGHP